MPYAPGVQDISGQLRAQGIAQAGDAWSKAIGSIGKSVTDAMQTYKQNQYITNQALGKFTAATQADPTLLKFLESGGQQEDPNAPKIPISPEVLKSWSRVKDGKTLDVYDAAILGSVADAWAKNKSDAMQNQLAQLKLDQAKAAANFMSGIGQPGATGGQSILSTLAGQNGQPIERAPRTSPMLGGAPAVTAQPAQAEAPSVSASDQVTSGQQIGLIPRPDTRPVVPPTPENARLLATYFNNGMPPTGAQVSSIYDQLNKQYESAISGSKLDQREKAYSVLEAEFIQKNKRQPDATERADLLRNAATVGTAGYSEGMAMMNKDGTFAGFAVFDKKSGDYKIRDNEGNLSSIPAGATPSTATSFTRNVLPMQDFMKLRKEVTDDELALQRYSKYIENVGDTKQGIDRLADSFTSRINTLFSTGKLTKPQMAQMLATGQLQALLGATRLNTIGGGVMTEQDAARVVARLGGDVDAFQNKEVVRRAIADVYSEKYRNYEDALSFYNNAVDDFYGAKGHKRATPLQFDPSMKLDSVSQFGSIPEEISPEQQLLARKAELERKAKGK